MHMGVERNPDLDAELARHLDEPIDVARRVDDGSLAVTDLHEVRGVGEGIVVQRVDSHGLGSVGLAGQEGVAVHLIGASLLLTFGVA
jgi:hypothetical protein